MISLELEHEPIAVDVVIDEQERRFAVMLADGRSLSIPFDWYPRLEHGTTGERGNWQLFGNGFAIEWTDLDEHVGIDGLLAGRKSGESEASLRRWLSSRQRV